MKLFRTSYQVKTSNSWVEVNEFTHYMFKGEKRIKTVLNI